LLLLASCQQQQDLLAAYPWLYLRNGTIPSSREELVSLVAVGDILLGRGVAAPEQALEAVTPWLSQADITLGNLEGIFDPAAAAPAADATPSAQPPAGQPIYLSMSPQAANWLAEAGFDVIGMANNHALDAGSAGLALTVETLRQADLTVTGAGQELLLHPIIYQVDDLRLAILAVDAIPIGPVQQPDSTGWDIARWDQPAVQAAVRQARYNADVVIISIHWGYEYQVQVDPAQQAIAGALFEAGADVVMGHHPHVTQVTDVFTLSERTRLVAYSLGNFVFDQGEGETGQAQALRLFFDAQGLRAAQVLLVVSGPRPRLLPPEDKALAVPALPAAPSQVVTAHPIYFTCNRQDCTQVDPDDTAPTSLPSPTDGYSLQVLPT
jgi:poly-gamma-glutamate synthesis protein (capsule biosynthesis protein)